MPSGVRIGPYEIVAMIGRGGSGTVYRARPGGGGPDVAIKLLQRTEPEALARFQREQRLQEALGLEQGFVPLLGTGELPSGPYLVMPFLPGGTLRARLQRGPLTLPEAVALGITLASAMSRAHELGIVHRDLKPENVLFAPDGRPLVADLGLAKHFSLEARGASQSVSLSRDGVLCGTAGYMPREQMADFRAAGPAADVFALGAILHECLTGEPAFAAESALELITRVESGTREPLPASTPRWLASVVDRALAREPERRFPDAAALVLALSRGGPERRSLLFPALGLGLTLLVALTFVLLSRRSVAPAAPPPRVAPPPRAAPPPPPRPVVPPPKHADAGAEHRAFTRLAAASELMGKNDYVAAIGELTAALDQDDHLLGAWTYRALCRGKIGDYTGAIGDYTQAIALDPEIAVNWHNRAFSRQMAGDTRGALSDYSRAVELDPGLTSSWQNSGQLKDRIGDYRGAIADFDRAIALDARTAIVVANRAASKEHAGDVPGALADYTRALELDPKLVVALSNRATLEGKQGDLEAAIRDATAALAIDPTLYPASQIRALAREARGDHEGAIADLTSAIAFHPGVALLYAARAEHVAKAGNYVAAIDDVTKALALDPSSADAWNNRGWFRSHTGDLDGAIEDATHAIALSPGEAYVWHSRGWARARKGDHAGASEDFTRALALDATRDATYSDRGASLEALGRREAAKADYARSLELAPAGKGAEAARLGLERLRGK